ncbi:MAG TPA: alpha/beta fold hydrolase, partial [Dehalococcoidia bacterium]|nr:alpha/beta fold hydrolase [Dehalococcoidia bacterium]
MIYSFEDCELDTGRFEMRRDGAGVPMERQVFDVLAYLVEHNDRLVPKEELLDKVWGDRFVGDAALNSRVMAVRRAIGDSGKEQRLIKTVHGRGYRFVAPVAINPETPERSIEPITTKLGAPTPAVPERREQEIRFCSAPDGVRLAYAVVGKGAPLVKAPNWLSHLEFEWRSPVWRHWLEELSRDNMFVRYDQRGCGLSDWDVADLSWDAWVRDLETVVDVLGLERFPLLGISQGGSVAMAYAVRHPERVSHLILYGAYAQGWRMRSKGREQIEEEEAVTTLMRSGWGRDNPAYRQIFASSFIPGANLEEMRWFDDLCRVSASPENAVHFREVAGRIDVTDLLPDIQVPTLVLHARGDLRVFFDQGRQLAAAIPGARFVPLDSENHILLENEPAWGKFLREVRAFLGVEAETTAALAEAVHTILFTDLEGSTALTHRLGDRKAREVLREHEIIVREALSVHGGSEVKTMGDGFMAAFQSATRALECAVAIQQGISRREDGLERLRVRIGVNAGEPIVEQEDFFGTVVVLAARLASK